MDLAGRAGGLQSPRPGTMSGTGFVKNATGAYKASAERSLIATFRVTGFLDFIYFTNYETSTRSPTTRRNSASTAYYSEWSTNRSRM